MDINTLFSVKDKVVLVTGGGRGVGEMIASAYVANGAKVYISSRDAKACDETAKALTAQGPGKCIAIPGDLSKLEECHRLAKELSNREEVLNVLVNNSGVTWGATLADYPDAAFAKVMTLNVQRVFTLTQALVPMLQKGSKRDGVGRIINIGSVNGVNPPPMETYAYSSSKAAVHMLTRHLAGQIGSDITVNALALGPFRSKMMKATLESFEQEIAGGLAISRIGEPSDVGGACLWLSSKAGAWVTGAIIPIDGGGLVSGRARL